MKTPLSPILAVSFFATLGNGQDGAVPPPPPNGYGIQGNVAWTKAQHEADLANAALAARQKKAVMNSMASVSLQPPVATSAEQYLAVNRPPAMPPSEMSYAPSPVRRDSYVPQFEAAPARSGRGEPSTAPVPSFTAPEKKAGLFGLFKSKDKVDLPDAPVSNPYTAPASAYPETSMIAAPDPASAPPLPPVSVVPTVPETALAAATEGSAPPEKPSFFGRLFGKEKATQPSSVPDPTLLPPAPPAMPAAPVATEPVSIPGPPSFDGPVTAPPPPSAPVTTSEGPGDAGSSIFVKRTSGTAATESATVKAATQVTVDGVLVRLFEGTAVTILEKSGSMAKIRLPDGREGSVATSALGR